MARQPLNAYLTRVLPGGALTMNPGGELYLYEVGTTDEANVWDAKVGGTIVTQPLSADADGSFPGYWVEDDRDYDRVIVGDALNATQSWRVRKGSRYVIYPRDYGAVEDGVTDETDALRDCIDDAIAHDKDITIAFRPITYVVDGDPVTNRTGNTILPIVGDNITESITLEGQGLGYNSPRRTIIKTTRTTDAYDPLLGVPSVIGGQTREQGSQGLLACGPVTFRGISVEVPNNPAIAGIDAIGFGGVILDRSGVIAGNGQDASITPENPWAFGLRLPGPFAFGLIDTRGFKARQMYAGIIVHKPGHITFGSGSGAQRCVLGIGFEELPSGTGGSPPISGGYVQLDACQYLLAGWNAVDGAKSTAANMVRHTISNLRIEAEPNNSGLFPEIASILDANDKLVGRISIHRGVSDFFSGAAQGVIDGAGNLDIYNPVNPNMATRRTTVPANVDLMTSQLVIYLDDTVGDVKVMFKAKDSAGTPVTGELAVETAVGVETFETSASMAATAAVVVASASVVGEPPVGAGLAASNLYLWHGGAAPTGVALDNTEMTWLNARGFKIIHNEIGFLRGFGGTQDFRSDGGSVAAANYDHQELIQNSDLVDRWHAYGSNHRVHLAWKLPHTTKPPAAPVADWWDDTKWIAYCDRVEELAAFGNWAGFDGMSADWEVFNDGLGSVAVPGPWYWDYPTNTHTEAQVRAKAKERGAQVMAAINAGMPNADLYMYGVYFPEDWPHQVATYLDFNRITGEGWVNWNFLSGMLAEGGYSRMWTNTAYEQKSPHIDEFPKDNTYTSEESWANAFRYQINRLGAVASEDLTSAEWEYAHTRFKYLPFAWLDEIPNVPPTAWSYKRPAAYHDIQLQAMRKWSMGEMFAVFDYGGFNTSSYVDHNGVSYNSILEDAAVPGTVATVGPSLPVPTLGGTTITGTATSTTPSAMWAIKWEDNAGGSGTAECDYQIVTNSSNVPAVPAGQILTDRYNWTIQLAAITPAATSVTITAVDSHMLESTPRVVSGI